ncbi:hypothetical protein DFA_06394 [Cavenderia fasciculata]|uniref:Paramecium surface antigen repeat-containing protein n=1 Tax=Cavenderia fasciculata TaxID=261658 RepID=F4PIV8_CACFS|nr:uncharacterized protein DFA_06394 [Cavenderia fasciculata]EGG24244.1 hypothetical protein DFA_06394 [Cavenderia fasciculata]|eukprot:XP_004362095.1 hypothetical protein DFA_06394 [Cavenderia fasciculata]
MMKEIIVICILASLLIVGSSAQSTCNGDTYLFSCAEEGDLCFQNGSIRCGYGYGCLPNPIIPQFSVLAELDGGSSYEPYPAEASINNYNNVMLYHHCLICIKLGAIGSPCFDTAQCMAGLHCYDSNNNGTCQQLSFAQLGEDCRLDQECYSYLKCDPFERECAPDIHSDYQCVSNIQCSYGFQCNTTSHRCVPRSSLGQVCERSEDGFSYMYCQEDLVCNGDSEGKYTCVTPFSVAIGKGCIRDYEDLYGENGFYISPCQAGSNCYLDVCTALNITAASVNCSADINLCSAFESCQCNNATYFEGATGQCVSTFVTNTDTINKCVEYTTELLSCLKDNECTGYAQSIELEEDLLVPNSCGYRHCHSEICNIQAECISQPPSPAPTCGAVDLDELMYCQDFSSASTLSFTTASILFAVATIGQIAAQSCISNIYYPYQCVEQGKECNQNNTCTYGFGCIQNPFYPNNNVDSILADIGGSSFEPIPERTCQYLGRIGDSCDDDYAPCLEGLSCYNSISGSRNQTCQILNVVQLGFDCSFDGECMSYLTCDPFSGKCIADLSNGQVLDGQQCSETTHCAYGFQCNYDDSLCVARATLGQQCGNGIEDKDYTVVCMEDTLCSANATGYTHCVAPFSLGLYSSCSENTQNLYGYDGIYISPCQAGLVCYDGLCSTLNNTAASVNCSAEYCVEPTETCLCANGTNSEGAAGRCVSQYITDSGAQTECVQLTTELLACAADNLCDDYDFYVRDQLGNGFLPGSCLHEHCSSEICKITEKCTMVNPVAGPSCIDKSLDEIGFCAEFSSANTLAVSASLIFLIVAALLF